MSKLYDVISRLEDIAAKDENETTAAEIPFQQPQKEKRQPWFRLILLSCIVVFAGFAVVAGVMWFKLQQEPASTSTTSQDKWIAPTPQEQTEIPEAPKPPPQTVITDTPPKPTPEKTPEVPLPAPNSQKTNPLVQQDRLESTEEDLPGEQRIIETQGTQAAMEPPSREFVDNPPLQLEKTEAVIPISTIKLIERTHKATVTAPSSTSFEEQTGEKQEKAVLKSTDNLSQMNESDQVVIEPSPLAVESPATVSGSKIVDNTFKLKQWLYQAEQLRKREDYQGAVIVFGQIWEISKQPEVGNNLAACLIELGRIDEAKQILTHARSIAPNDLDLEENLQLVERLSQP